MEILNNYSSIYCFIAFVIGAVFMLAMLSIAAMGKVKEPRNKVRFFVEKDNMELYLRMNYRKYDTFICNGSLFRHYGLKSDDFSDMKEGEIREVFINLED